MIQTYVAYGYRLGGPSTWALAGTAPADRLITPWFDETNPTHDLAARATAELTKGVISQQPTRRQQAAYEAQTPIMFDTAIEAVSVKSNETFEVRSSVVPGLVG